MSTPGEKSTLESKQHGADETAALLSGSDSGSSTASYSSVDAVQKTSFASFLVEDIDYSTEEEAQVVKILDRRLMPFILLTTFVLNMDRTNNSNAISDNLPGDLGFSIDVVNTATAAYSILFASACLSGAIIAKIVGPSRWIPILMFSWGLVTLAHVLIKDKFGYLTVRCFIAITEGGVIPTTLVYLGSFYKSTELATRLAFFWGVQQIASAVSGLMASGLLKLRGIYGLEGWKWLFLIDGIITLIVAVVIWSYFPKDVTSTKGGLRGPNSWFTHRQTQIAVTRLVRDDLSKRSYEKRVTLADIKATVMDVGVIGHVLLTMIGHTPNTPMHTYLPTVIKSFNFSVSAANALTAPPYIIQACLSIVMVRHSDKVRERGFHGAFGAGWQLCGWILLWLLPSSAPRSLKYLSSVIVASWPYTHPLNVAWLTENTGSIGKRTVASGLIIGASNLHGIWGSQIYRADDAPEFRRGNLVNIRFAATAFALWFIQKAAYTYRNKFRARKLATLTEAEIRHEERVKESKGNESLLFQFTT